MSAVGAILPGRAHPTGNPNGSGQPTHVINLIDEQRKQDQLAEVDKANAATAGRSSAIQALRAAMSVMNGMGGTVASGPMGAAPAPTTAKTLLGL